MGSSAGSVIATPGAAGSRARTPHPASVNAASTTLISQPAPPSTLGCSAGHSATASSVITTPRPSHSSPRRRSAREGIHHQVHGELRVVHREEALVVGVVVPLRAVVLAAVQEREPAVALDAL